MQHDGSHLNLLHEYSFETPGSHFSWKGGSASCTVPVNNWYGMSIDLRRKRLVRFSLCSDGGGARWYYLRAALGNDEETNGHMGPSGGGRAGAARLRGDCKKRGSCAAPGGRAAASACRSE